MHRRICYLRSKSTASFADDLPFINALEYGFEILDRSEAYLKGLMELSDLSSQVDEPLVRQYDHFLLRMKTALKPCPDAQPWKEELEGMEFSIILQRARVLASLGRLNEAIEIYDQQLCGKFQPQLSKMTKPQIAGMKDLQRSIADEYQWMPDEEQQQIQLGTFLKVVQRLKQVPLDYGFRKFAVREALAFVA